LIAKQQLQSAARKMYKCTKTKTLQNKKTKKLLNIAANTVKYTIGFCFTGHLSMLAPFQAAP